MAVPTGTAAEPARIAPFAAHALVGSSGSRALIVDDNAAIRRVLALLLRQAGVEQVQSTGDSAEAVPLFEQFAPDIVFLDLHMPGLSGFDVLERLKPLIGGDTPVPVVMLTGERDQAVRTRALRAGASDFVCKPFDTTEVILRTRSLLETRHLHLRFADQNRGLEARVAARTAELEAAQLEMLQRLAATAELRDDETGQHTQRVGSLSGLLARALGFDITAADLIGRAATLHDIGKVGVPDAVLRKPGKLTLEEQEAMRAHSAIGARILAGGGSKLINLAEQIARYHHERWDGAGYPDALSGPAIPLEARIVAVADFFDALTHERPYRGAMSVDRTLALLQEGSGKHFDPEVVRAFVALMSGTLEPSPCADTARGHPEERAA